MDTEISETLVFSSTLTRLIYWSRKLHISRADTGVSTRGLGYNLGWRHVVFVVYTAAFEQGFLGFLQFRFLIIITSFLHTHISPPPKMWDSPDHAAHYQIFWLHLWAGTWLGTKREGRLSSCINKRKILSLTDSIYVSPPFVVMFMWLRAPAWNLALISIHIYNCY
jgi:hypothetical protein